MFEFQLSEFAAVSSIPNTLPWFGHALNRQSVGAATYNILLMLPTAITKLHHKWCDWKCVRLVYLRAPTGGDLLLGEVNGMAKLMTIAEMMQKDEVSKSLLEYGYCLDDWNRLADFDESGTYAHKFFREKINVMSTVYPDIWCSGLVLAIQALFSLIIAI